MLVDMRWLLLLTAILLCCGCLVPATPEVAKVEANIDGSQAESEVNTPDTAAPDKPQESQELETQQELTDDAEELVELEIEDLRCDRKDADYILFIDVMMLGVDNTWSFEFPLRAPKKNAVYTCTGWYSCGAGGAGGEGIGVTLDRNDGHLAFDVSIRRSWRGVVEADFDIDDALIDEPVSGRRTLENGAIIQWRFNSPEGGQL